MNGALTYCTGMFLIILKLYLLCLEALWHGAWKQKTRCSHLQRVWEFVAPAAAGKPELNARKACSALRNAATR